MPSTSEWKDARSQLLVTKSGKPKHRFTWKEKLVLLGLTANIEETERRLRAFRKLFAFRYMNGIITKVGCGPRCWSALGGRLTLAHIVRHLLAATVPTRPPQWVGARSLSSSYFLCIDVDADRTRGQLLAEQFDVDAMDEDLRQHLLAQIPKHPGKPTLQERRERVEQALRLMGVNPRNRNEVLVQRTPSGGFHYYLFFAEPYSVDQYHQLLRNAGLQHCPGQVEFFPSTRQALRLPFGHLPGRPDRPKAWIEFIDRFRSARIRRHVLSNLYDNTERNRESQSVVVSTTQRKPTPPNTIQQEPRRLGIPKSARPAKPVRIASDSSIYSFQDAESLMADGIREKGTRNRVLNQLAAHLIWFQHQSAEEACDTLTAWALDNRHESVDIAYDLAHGTNKVAKQIALMCRWYETRKQTKTAANGTTNGEAAFTQREVKTLRVSLETVPITERRHQAQFLLHFLWFAKQHGRPTDDGQSWEASPAVRPVLRRWPNCHHMNYKLRITRAIEAGILQITRERWQSPSGPGRARTYRLSITPEPSEKSTISYEEALEVLSPGGETLGTSVEVASDENRDQSPKRTGVNDGPIEADSSAMQPTTAESKRDNQTSLHPTRASISMGPRTHQRHQEPHEAPDLPSPGYGAVRTCVIERGIERRRNGSQIEAEPVSAGRQTNAGRKTAQSTRAGRSPPLQPEYRTSLSIALPRQPAGEATDADSKATGLKPIATKKTTGSRSKPADSARLLGSPAIRNEPRFETSAEQNATSRSFPARALAAIARSYNCRRNFHQHALLAERIGGKFSFRSKSISISSAVGRGLVLPSR